MTINQRGSTPHDTPPQDRDSTTTSLSRRGLFERAARFSLLLPGVWLLAGCGDQAQDEAGRESGSSGSSGSMSGGASAKPSASEQASAPAEQAKQKMQEPAQQAQASPMADEPASDALVTEVPEMASLVKTLNYTNQSQKPDQRCANCQLYYEPQNGRGRCRLFAQGLVTADGWCTSWIKKPNAA